MNDDPRDPDMMDPPENPCHECGEQIGLGVFCETCEKYKLEASE